MTILRAILIMCTTLAAVWLLCAILTYGLFLGYWQGAYPQHARVLCAGDKAQAWRVTRQAFWLAPMGLAAVGLTLYVDAEDWYSPPWPRLQWTCEEEEL